MTITIDQLYEANKALLHKAGVQFREVEHEPVFSYEKAEEVRKQFDLTGIESKSLFIRLKDGRYCMFISVEGKRLNSKRLKKVLGSKPSICSDEELIKLTGCLPKCACPFGHSKEITLIIDQEILNGQKFIFSPGPAEKTIEIDSVDIQKILDYSNNEIIYYTEAELTVS